MCLDWSVLLGCIDQTGCCVTYSLAYNARCPGEGGGGGGGGLEESHFHDNHDIICLVCGRHSGEISIMHGGKGGVLGTPYVA